VAVRMVNLPRGGRSKASGLRLWRSSGDCGVLAYARKFVFRYGITWALWSLVGFLGNGV